MDTRQLLLELDTKIRKMQNRWIFKQSDKVQELLYVKEELKKIQPTFYGVTRRAPVDASDVLVAIHAAREQTQVFRYGKVGKFFAGLCMFSTKPQTKSDLLLDKIERALTT